jgi:hypothetical protein
MWATVLPLVASPGLVWALVTAWKYNKRLNLLQHAYDKGGARGVRAVGEAIALSDGRGRVDGLEPDPLPPARATADREQPKPIERGNAGSPDNMGEPPP